MAGQLELDLPPHQSIPFRNESDLYGASYIAQQYTGITTERPINGIWNHGWAPDFYGDHPARFAGAYKPENKNAKYFVARKSQEECMKEGGYPFVKAIGLPILYVKKQAFERIPNSLLVMPVHSTFTTEHDWNFEAYVRRIKEIQNQFSQIVVSLHVSCIQKGYWIHEFQRNGFQVIQSITGISANDHPRLQKLFSTFEYVTTNGFGSHLAYGSYYGAKVSIYGDYPTYRKEDFKNDEVHTAFPHLLDRTYKMLSEENVRKHVGEFFTHPKAAVQRVEWAKKELGYDNKLTPEEMKELFGWSWEKRFLFDQKMRIREKLKQYYASLPAPIKSGYRKVKHSFAK
jgi:hypothetical protein